ncbi:MAG TPA: hypothetical protein VK424_00780 [Thermoplasmata archaeon]|nr:hypothetical protein [Thermoplasmata archaeon]
MATRLCPTCGSPNPEKSAYCGRCGVRIPDARRSARSVGRFTALRFQVDPTDPPPERDVRWLILILGICSVIVSVFLLAVYSIVSAATSGSGFPCGGGPESSPCTGSLVDYLFLVPGLALLAIGAVAVVYVLYEMSRP